MSELSKMAGYKINIQKLAVSKYTNEQCKKVIQEEDNFIYNSIES